MIMKPYVVPHAQTTQACSAYQRFVLELGGRVFISAFREPVLNGL